MAQVDNSYFEQLTPNSLHRAENLVLENEDLKASEVSEGHGKSNQEPLFLNGHQLPVTLRPKVRDQLIGVALKEIDPFYQKHNTFVVIGKGSKILYRFDEAESYLKSSGGWRHQAITILTHGLFNYFMVVTVVLNCVLLGITSQGTNQSSRTNQKLDFIPQLSRSEATIASCAFLSIYIGEFLLKILARGLLKRRNHFSCLMISWSWVDVFVILTGIWSVIFSENQVLLGFRVLKLIPLLPIWLCGYDRTIRKIWKPLLSILFYAIVVTSLFALLGVELYAESFRMKCVQRNDTNDSNDDTSTSESNIDEELSRSGWLYDDTEQEYDLCGLSAWSKRCPENFTCKAIGGNPQGGYVSFDTVLLAELSVLNLIFQDYAEFIYERVWINGSIGTIYFILIFFMGTFSIGALIFATIGRKFEVGFSEMSTQWKPISDSKKDEETHEVMVEGDRREIGTAVVLNNLRSCVKHENFDLIVTIVIIIDIVLHGLDHFGVEENKAFVYFLTFSNKSIQFVYVVESILKILSFKPKLYFKSCWNRFDFIVVILILVNFFVESTWLHYTLTITTLKIVPRWPTLNFMLTVIHKSICTHLTWLFGIYAILLFLFAYIGNAGFGVNYTVETKRFHKTFFKWTFVNMWYSVRTIFRAFCGEWIETLWELLEVSNGTSWAIILMVSAAVIGNLLVTCLVVGIILIALNLLINFEAKSSERKRTSLGRIFIPCSWLGMKICPVETEVQEETTYSNTQQQLDATKSDMEMIDKMKIENIEEFEEAKKSKSEGASSLFVKIFDHLGYIIFTSTLILILSLLVMKWSFIAEIIFVLYFGIEILVRIATSGFHKETFKYGLIFDIIMIINSVLALILDWREGIFYIGSFRLLMLVSRIDKLQIVTSQLLQQLNLLVQYFLSTLFIWYVFCLFGMNFFMGKFYKCVTNNNSSSKLHIPIQKYDCDERNLTWINSGVNFDSVAQGFLALAQVGTMNGWLNIIDDIENARDVDEEPLPDSNTFAILFIVAFLLIAVLFPLSIMFGVLINHFRKTNWTKSFTESKKSNKNHDDNTEGTRSPKLSENLTLQKLQTCVMHTNFELWVALTIIADCTAQGIKESLRDNHAPKEVLIIFRLAILLLYIVELLLRIMTQKLKFFNSFLNILLLVVVITSIIDLMTVEFAIDFISFDLLRNFRILHLLTIKKFGNYIVLNEVRNFGKSLYHTFPALLSIFFFYSILFCSFAIFASVAFHPMKETFFWYPFLQLFKISTISGWGDFYSEIAYETCNSETVVLNECHPIIGAIYAISFLGITIFCFVNMYMVVVLQIIDQLRNDQNQLEGHQAMATKSNTVEDGVHTDDDGGNLATSTGNASV